MNSQIKDLTGSKVGRWKVVGQEGRASNNEVLWKCQCTCGTVRLIRGAKIRQGKSKSCGCMTDKSDITGNKYGEWTVIRRTRDHKNESKWLCTNGDVTVMMTTSQVFKGNLMVGSGKGKWKIVGSTGRLMKNGDNMWVVGSFFDNEMILAECGDTGIIGVFDPETFDSKRTPPLERDRKPQGEDLTGQSFKFWKVIERAENNAHGQVMWNCQCQKCGVFKDIASFYLKRGAGCSNCREVFGEDDHDEVENPQET